MKLFDQVFSTIERSLDLRYKRHAVLSSNVANSETPGFKARELDFAGELSRAIGGEGQSLRKTDAKHMDVTGDQSAHTVFDYAGSMGNDGNNVDLDVTMGKMSSNSRAYNNAITMYDLKLRLLRAAIRSRSGGF